MPPRKQTQPVFDREAPTPEQIKKAPYRRSESGTWVNIATHPLDYYHNMTKGGINDPQFYAGSKLLGIYMGAGLAGFGRSVFAALLEPQVDGSRTAGGFAEHQISAMRIIRDAIGSVQGRRGQQLIRQVIIEGEYIKDVLCDNYRRPNELMARFREALDDLVYHFHIPIPEHLQDSYPPRRERMADKYHFRPTTTVNKAAGTVTQDIRVIPACHEAEERLRIKLELEDILRRWGVAYKDAYLIDGAPLIKFDESGMGHHLTLHGVSATFKTADKK